jgi:predicted phage terminase large subunit-like protein
MGLTNRLQQFEAFIVRPSGRRAVYANRQPSRQQLEEFAEQLAEALRRKMKTEHSTRGYRDEDGVWRCGLLQFVRDYWHVLEPGTKFVDGWALEAVCEHLEAVTFGEIQNLLINVPPGFMKSLLTDVFWPAWEWGPMGLAHLRYVAFSYSSSLTERDNGKFRDLITHPDYQALYADKFRVRKIGETKVTNWKHGWKLATSVGGVGTGERGDRIILDDPHNVKESESEVVRDETTRWFRESMTTRLNNMETGAKIVIMQRVHEDDVSGVILSNRMPYVHLLIPMEYVWPEPADDGGAPMTSIGWSDPRWREREEDCEGVLAWPERFSPKVVGQMKLDLGPYAYAGQAQQMPTPRGGAIFMRDWWQPLDAPMGSSFPVTFDYVVASLDGAFTEQEQNDPCALTVWGVFQDPATGFNRALLMHAWRKRLKIMGVKLQQQPGEHPMRFKERQMREWGLVEWCNDTCTRFNVDVLLIEGKASGISAAQAIGVMYPNAGWMTRVQPVKGDKEARAHAVVPPFAQGMIYVPWPWRTWTEMVIDEMGVFPKHKHDDLTDSATQAIKHLRDLGMLRTSDAEARTERDKSLQPKRKLTPLYPV